MTPFLAKILYLDSEYEALEKMGSLPPSSEREAAHYIPKRVAVDLEKVVACYEGTLPFAPTTVVLFDSDSMTIGIDFDTFYEAWCKARLSPFTFQKQ